MEIINKSTIVFFIFFISALNFDIRPRIPSNTQPYKEEVKNKCEGKWV